MPFDKYGDRTGGIQESRSSYVFAGLCIFPYENWLLSPSSLTDLKALINTRRKAKVHRKQYFAKTCIRTFRKFSEMLGKIF